MVIIYIFNLSTGESKCVKDKELEGFSMNVHKAIGDIYAKSEQSRLSNQEQGDAETVAYYKKLGYGTVIHTLQKMLLVRMKKCLKKQKLQ